MKIHSTQNGVYLIYFIVFIFLMILLPNINQAQSSLDQKTTIDSLKIVVETAPHDTIKINAWTKWTEQIRRTDLDTFLELSKKIEKTCYEYLDQNSSKLSLFEKLFYQRSIAYSFYCQGYYYDRQGDFDKAINYYKQSLEVEKELDRLVSIGRVFNSIGYAYEKMGDYASALNYYKRSLNTNETIENHKGISKALTNIGIVYENQGNYAKAIDFYVRSLELSEKTADKSGMIGALNNIGIIYDKQNEYDKAIDYYSKSLKIAKSENQHTAVANAYANIGVVYERQKQYEKALDYLTNSLEIRDSIGDQYGVSTSLNGIGVVYDNQKNYSKALEYYKKSLAIKEELGRTYGIVIGLANMGVIYTKLKDYTNAIDYLIRSRDVAMSIDNLYLTKEINGNLYEAYKRQGNANKALQTFETYIENRDSLEREENLREVIRQEYKYSYEKQAFADSLQNAEAQQLANAQLTAQKAQNLQQRQLAIFGGVVLFLLLLGSIFFFYQRRKSLQDKLRLEQKEAERLKELDMLKTQLYTNLTHEFRTPLTIILGMAEKILSSPKRFAEEGAHMITRNGKNLLRIVNQLLDLSKIENQALKLQLQQSDIVGYIHYITDAFHSFANNKNLSIRFFSNQESILMDYDQEQIKQILTNLISNAIKFTSSGGEIWVKLHKENNILKIEIKDNGIGIPVSSLPFIFDRFYQVDNSETRAYDGTGIGLAHTKELVRLMKGTIEVKSDVDEGTTFTIFLPIRQEAPLSPSTISDIEVTVPNSTENIESTTKNLMTLPTVLIIEDNADVVNYLKNCLDKDYHLEVAYNGDIGIEMAIEKIPDLIISDVMMPGKDGFEVCQTVKTDQRTSHIPVILLTAKVDIASKLVGLEQGADAYLPKPFDPKELSIRVHKLLENRNQLKQFFGQLYTPFSKEINQNLPKESSKDELIENQFIQKMNAILEQNIQNEDFALPEFCRQLGMSRSQLFRKTKALTNMAPSDYIRTYRLQKAKYLLEHSDLNVTEVAYDVGFKNPSYFSNSFQKMFGFAPSSLKTSE